MTNSWTARFAWRLALLCVCPGLALAAPGDLDVTFAGRGWVELSIPGHDVYVRAVLAEPDGGVVALANAQALPHNGVSPSATIVIARWRADGTPDTSFGVGGLSTIAVAAHPYSQGNTLLRGLDARYVVGGWAINAAMDGRALLVRLLPDGTPDPLFGVGGTVVHDFDPTRWDGIVSLVAAGSGYAGLVHRTGTVPMLFAGFTSSGAIDAAFGSNGMTEVAPVAYLNFGRDLVVLPDGRLLGGAWAEAGPGARSVGLVRLLADGTPDASFGPGGVRTSFPGRTIEALTADPGGAVFVGRDFVGRVLDDGTPDPAFAFSGLAGRFPELRDVAFFGGRLWAGGETYADDGAAIPMLVRMLPDGRVDPTFGTQGYARVRAIGVARVYGLDVDGRGRAILGGELYPAGAPRGGFVARVERDADTLPSEVPLGGGLAWLVLTLLLALTALARVASGPRK